MNSFRTFSLSFRNSSSSISRRPLQSTVAQGTSTQRKSSSSSSGSLYSSQSSISIPNDIRTSISNFRNFSSSISRRPSKPTVAQGTSTQRKTSSSSSSA